MPETLEERVSRVLCVPKKDALKILSLQSPLVQQALRQTDEERKIAREAPIIKAAQVLKEDGSVDIAPRKITAEEEKAYEDFRMRRGAYFEEARGAYLSKMAKAGKIHHSLLGQIETPHVMPPEEVKERAKRAWLGHFTPKAIKEKFAEIMGKIFKPTHAEIVAAEMKRRNDK